MNRRSFFGTLFGGLLCKFLPSIKPEPFDISRVDCMDISTWGITYAQAHGTWNNLDRSTYPLVWPNCVSGSVKSDSPEAVMLKQFGERYKESVRRYEQALDAQMYGAKDS